jgi:hypothetical protein
LILNGGNKNNAAMPLQYAHKLNKLEVGEWYLVAHAVYYDKDRKRKYQLPVLPHLHSDPQFSVPVSHYHIDGRFPMHADLINGYDIVLGVTNRVFYPGSSEVKLKKRCQRVTTGINPPIEAMVDLNKKSYIEWYKSYIGKSCKGKKCPHLGANMIEVNGKLFCPLHDLHACPKTEVIINHPAMEKLGV